MVSVQLNLRYLHSHPQFRNALAAIRILVSLLAHTRNNKLELVRLLNGLPQPLVRQHLTQLHQQALVDRLYRQFKYVARTYLERLLTEYVDNITAHNEFLGHYEHPLAVHFGAMLPWHFLCASDGLLDAHLSKDRPDYSEFKKVVRSYALLSKTQQLLLRALEQASEIDRH